MSKEEYFNKELIQGNYVFYLNEQERAYVPDTKEEFNLFLEALYSFIEEPTEIQKLNYKLVQDFPFLLPKNRFDRGINIIGEYGYRFEHTEISAMPKGWLIAFGKEMISEIKKDILAYDTNFLYEYTITDIKEKYGSLRWYDSGATEKMYKTIGKYENLSIKKCVVCGEPGEIDNDRYWLEPLCIKHAEDSGLETKLLEAYNEAYRKLGE